MVVNIRGTHGSGKSYVVRELMRLLGKKRKVVRRKGKIVGYSYPNGVHIVGDYRKELSAPGCDCIHSLDEIYNLVKKRAKQFRCVVFEGVLPQNVRGRSLALSAEFPTVWVFLNTSLERCIVRVQKRRFSNGKIMPFHTNNLITKHRTTQLHLEQFRAAGERVIVVSSKKAPRRILRLINEEQRLEL